MIAVSARPTRHRRRITAARFASGTPDDTRTRGPGSALVELGPDPEPQRVELDEALGVPLIVDRVLLERDDVGAVQALGRLAPERRDVALEQLEPRRAGDVARDVVDQALHRLALGREPEP